MLVFGLLFSQKALKAQEQDSTTALNAVDTLSAAETSINVPKVDSSIENIINYDAVDSIYFDIRNQKATLYGKAHVDYEDLNVNAPTIVVDLKNNRLEAIARIDSNGKVLEYPILKQGKEESQAKFIGYNWKTKRGYVEDVYMNQGGGYIHTNKAYLDEDKTMYVKNASYTSCNLAQPHYHFRLNRAKIIPDDKIIGSLVNLYIDSIPTPLAVPFAILPMQQKRTSGFILPAFNNFLSNGLAIQGLGYYWAINDSLSTQFSADLFVSGSFTLENDTRYKVRYKHSGSLNTTFSRIVNNFDEFSKTARREFSITWNHSTASQRPRKLTANVNFETNRNNSFNFVNPEDLSVPSINSAVSWYLPLRGIPFDMRLTASHNQIKNSNGLAQNSFTLPSYTLGYRGNNNPFKLLPYLNKKPSLIRQKVLNKFQVAYTNTGSNKASSVGTSFSNLFIDEDRITGFSERDTSDLDLNLTTLDDIFARSKFTTAHNFTFSMPINIGNFTLSPSLNYNENWYFSRTGYDFNNNSASDTLRLSRERDFYRVGRYSTGATLSTTVYNFYSLGRKKTLKDKTVIDKTVRIRQTMQPRLRFTSSPDYSQDENVLFFYELDDVTRSENRFREFSSRPSINGESRSLGFGLSNTFEMKLPETEKRMEKLKARGKTKNEPIELFTLNLAEVGYNLAADSLNLGNFNFVLRNNSLLNGLLRTTVTANFTPYDYAENEGGLSSRTINKFWAEDHNTLARYTRLLIQSNLSLTPDVFKRKAPMDQDKEDSNGENNPTEPSIYDPFSLPWTLNIGYVYSRTDVDPVTDPTVNNGLTFTGSLRLSEKWSATGGLNYDVKNNEFTAPKVSLIRNLHCWTMSFYWVPFGAGQYYQFKIGVNSGQLQALKWDKDNLNQRIRF